MSEPRTVRVRFAPSPTGLLHIGGLRTALYNYLLARKHGGTFILRIEDTDQARYVAEAEADIIESLHWANLAFDEGPGVGGPHEPYYQSQRGELYRAAAKRLVAEGHAYYAFDTEDEIEAMRKRLADAGHVAPRYDASTRGDMTNSLTLSEEEVARRRAADEPHVVRLLVPLNETVQFEDAIRGTVSFDTSEIDDQVLVKSDGHPTYHLANVVDDHEMAITDVVRGEEWLPSTPKHILLYKFLGWEAPRMAHLPLILSPNGGKLSKRNADDLGIPVSVKQYREAGYEPEALLNFLAFLGWNPGTDQEIFPLENLVSAYSLERTGNSGVQFNLDKLNWYNGQFIRLLPLERLMHEARPAVDAAGLEYDDAQLRCVCQLMQERINFVHEIATVATYFFQDPETYEDKGLNKNWKADSGEVVAAFADRLETLPHFKAETLEAELRTLADERNIGAGKVIHPVRLAVSGVSAGPSLFEMLEAIGQKAVVRRLRRAAAELG